MKLSFVLINYQSLQKESIIHNDKTFRNVISLESSKIVTFEDFRYEYLLLEL